MDTQSCVKREPPWKSSRYFTDGRRPGRGDSDLLCKSGAVRNAEVLRAAQGAGGPIWGSAVTSIALHSPHCDGVSGACSDSPSPGWQRLHR